MWVNGTWFEVCAACGCVVGGGCPESTDEERESYRNATQGEDEKSETQVEVLIAL